ncbi:hypothetical protein EDD76_11427 [Kineothrix alysoides]|uniref:Uncharacterized protein n=1 Tax=Kineothrix alysoides TaxID=1469948 RepID=A0A4R1QQE1_9FIRM|nr:hypothetical protein EDD76_11427 [Kineothrix alysoides]
MISKTYVIDYVLGEHYATFKYRTALDCQKIVSLWTFIYERLRLSEKLILKEQC